MSSRRDFLIGTAAVAGLSLATPALSQTTKKRIPANLMPTKVRVQDTLPAGEIHVVTDKTYLYWTLGNGEAIRYGVAVGREGRNFKGTATVRRKAEWPRWTPTANMIRLEPHIYKQFASGLPGGHRMNPLGARALYLYSGGRDTLYRIHGTPQPWTIGEKFGSGCIRMLNDHVKELYEQVPMGTKVTIY